MISRSSVQDALGLIFEPNANEEEIEIEQEIEEDVSEMEISIDLDIVRLTSSPQMMRSQSLWKTHRRLHSIQRMATCSGSHHLWTSL